MSAVPCGIPDLGALARSILTLNNGNHLQALASITTQAFGNVSLATRREYSAAYREIEIDYVVVRS